mgnify:CR=1 FL=1
MAGIVTTSDINISIHAPRAGSDQYKNKAYNCIKNFNPRSPGGERPHIAERDSEKYAISIHAPRAGSDSKAA